LAAVNCIVIVDMSSTKTDVLVLGSSIAGLMAAAWLKHQQPDLAITVIGPRVGDEKRPIVGESLVEPAILFFIELGMEDYLASRHELKNGLTFYHKLAPNDPSDRRYSVHAPMEKLYHRSRQLHRPAFDIELGRVAARLGVEFIEGRVTEAEVGRAGALHRVRGEGFEIEAPFIIDATGRKRVVGTQVTNYERPELGQRSAFWFRLADYEPVLSKLELSCRRPLDYDEWLATHHFMGQGNWIWCIPLRDDDGAPLLSMGITWRPDVFESDIRSLDDFLAYLDGEHPALAEMVRGGRIVDIQRYRNYLYKAEQVYSDDGWFLIGDAARSVDPLYSTGLSMTVVQVQQISEIIERRRGPGIAASDIDNLQRLWMAIADLRQADVTDQYRTMNDPFQACLRRYWNVSAWFNGLLPLWFNGYFNDPAAARVLLRFFQSSIEPSHAAWRLFEQVARELGEVEQADFDRLLDFDYMINRRFDCPPDEVGRHLRGLIWKKARLRLNLLGIMGIAGVRHLPGQLRPLLRELVMTAFVDPVMSRHPAMQGPRKRAADSARGRSAAGLL
jgi:flavin-dependent dehydrogenase